MFEKIFEKLHNVLRKVDGDSTDIGIKKNHLSHPKYRPDIDGLRAVAVLAVVAFHAFPNWVKGGFIGVDVFFVISGYLISTIIFENLDKGTFSFSEFYGRRIKRIFPALILVLVGCFIFGWFVLLADEYKQLGKHIAAGAGFISNIVFWHEAGYFDNTADTKPLLHLWSLGIEEQFYIVWPLILWLAWKRKFNLLTVTVIITIASFVLNLKGIKQNAVATFYSPQARFWELLSGSLLAWITLYKNDAFANIRGKIDNMLSRIVYSEKQATDGKTLANLLSFVGLLLLVYGFWRINKELSFPGKWALIPVIGTLLLLVAGSKAWVNRTLLSNKVAIWFGLISFPLYLWHWPLLSFARILESEVPSRNIRGVAVVLAVALAWLTYKFVERPIRFGNHGRFKCAVLVILMAIIGSFGFNKMLNVSVDARFNSRELLVAEAVENCNYYFPNWIKTTGSSNPCRMQRKEGNTIAIIGDSHAGHLYIGISELMNKNSGVIAFDASCAAPYIDIASATSNPTIRKIRENNYKLINSAYDYILNDKSIKTVILAHAPGCSFSDVKDMSNIKNSDKDIILMDGMRRTLDQLFKADKKVLILFDNPSLPYDPKKCNPRPFRLSEKSENDCHFPRQVFDSHLEYLWYKSIVNLVMKDYPQTLTYDLSNSLCDKESCYLAKNGMLLYLDRGHLNFEGSSYVAPHILNALK
jgi:peptidoglycan/LPS O-acetylase OafA/YrhL